MKEDLDIPDVPHPQLFEELMKRQDPHPGQPGEGRDWELDTMNMMLKPNSFFRPKGAPISLEEAQQLFDYLRAVEADHSGHDSGYNFYPTQSTPGAIKPPLFEGFPRMPFKK